MPQLTAGQSGLSLAPSACRLHTGPGAKALRRLSWPQATRRRWPSPLPPLPAHPPRGPGDKGIALLCRRLNCADCLHPLSAGGPPRGPGGGTSLCPTATRSPQPRPFAQKARRKGKGAPLMRSALTAPAVWPNQTGSIVMSGSSSLCCMMTWTILSGDSSASRVSSSLMKPRVSMSM